MTIVTTAIQVEQPIGRFYVTSIPACVLRELSFVDVRRILERENKTHGGIQRTRNEERLRDIRQYISMGDSSFPNSIIVTAKSEDLKAEPIKLDVGKNGNDVNLFELSIPEKEDVFKVIDGQHRLYGFDDENCKNYELVVTIFVDLAIEDQAYMFSTINLKQRPVDRSLVYDLYEEAQIYSPYKAAHNVAKLLNIEHDSPFHERIKLLGVAPRFEGELLYNAPLSQNAVVREILKRISRNPDADRELVRLGKSVEWTDDDQKKGLIFREFYAREEDWAIFAIMRNYFSAFAKSFPDEWDLDGGSLIPKTVGYGALMRVLVPVYLRGAEENDASESYFENIFKVARRNYVKSDIKLNFDYFDRAGSVEPKVAKFILSLCEFS